MTLKVCDIKVFIILQLLQKKKCINPIRVSSHVLAERVFQPKGGFSHLKTVSPYCWFAHQPRRSFSTLAPPPFFHSKNHNILPVKTFPLGSPDDWAEEAEAANWPPWPRPPHEHQPPAACLKVNVARLTAIIIMIIIRSVFVGSTSDCVTQQTLLRGEKKCFSNICASWRSAMLSGKVTCSTWGRRRRRRWRRKKEGEMGHEDGKGGGVVSTWTECCTKCLSRLRSQILWVQVTEDAVLSFTSLNVFKQWTTLPVCQRSVIVAEGEFLSCGLSSLSSEDSSLSVAPANSGHKCWRGFSLFVCF